MMENLGRCFSMMATSETRRFITYQVCIGETWGLHGDFTPANLKENGTQNGKCEYVVVVLGNPKGA